VSPRCGIQLAHVPVILGASGRYAKGTGRQPRHFTLGASTLADSRERLHDRGNAGCANVA
jgi:hypothetical protein